VDLKILICMWKAKQRVLPMDLQNVFAPVSEEDGHKGNIISKLLLHILHKNRCVCLFMELNCGTFWTEVCVNVRIYRPTRKKYRNVTRKIVIIKCRYY